MAAAKKKYYVVWEGYEPGIYESWELAQTQVDGYPGAKFKAYPDLESATAAYRGDDYHQMAIFRAMAAHEAQERQKAQSDQQKQAAPAPAAQPARPINRRRYPVGVRLDALAVDAACAHNPGPVEYRGVAVADGSEIFHQGPFPRGSNNIGEYLALIHAAALLAQRGDTTRPIYTDSRTALAWIRAGHSRTTIKPTAENARLLQRLADADAWLATHRIANPILKWDTDNWGEIPADFGRK